MNNFLILKENRKTGIAIIGAGISGLTTAYLLAKAGQKVVVLEKGECTEYSQSIRTTAHITHAFDDGYEEMERLHGVEGTKIIAESHTYAINLIEQILTEEKIACDFSRIPGYYFAEMGNEEEDIQKEYLASQRAGIGGTEILPCLPWNGKQTKKALVFPDQGQLHMGKYLGGLTAACIALGVEIYGKAEVMHIDEGEPHTITLKDSKKISAKHLVLATNSPINRNVLIHLRQSPYRTYVIGMECPQDTFPNILAWDLKDPYHYMRLDKKDGNILIVGGEDHRTGTENDMEKRYQKLEKWVKGYFQKLGKVIYKWSGQVMEPADGVGFVGVNPGSKNLYVITGDSGNGTTNGTLGAKIVSDLILGIVNPWSDLYSPSRFEIKATPEYLKEAGETNMEFKDWVTPGDVDNIQNIPKGEGRVIREGIRKIAIYRDENGVFHRRSAVCPHLGGIVSWNKSEKSWDCPIHGSRFGCKGKVIEAPAVSDLAED